MTDPQTIFLQLQEPCEGGMYRASVNTDGLPETEVHCASPHVMGIMHWCMSELGLKVFDRISPAGRWKPGDKVVPGLYQMEPIREEVLS